MNATLNRADVAAMRTSLASASASPPPDAAPLTAEMIGCGIDRIFGTSPAIIFCTVMPACARPIVRARGGLAPSDEVEPGAVAAARTGEHDHTAGGIVGERVEGFVQPARRAS